MTSRLDQSSPLAQPAPEPKKPRRAGRVLAVVAGLFLAYFLGFGMGHSNSTVQAQPVAQPAPVVTTRTVTVPGPTVTVPGPTVTVPGPTVTVQAAPPASSAPSASTPSAGSSFSSGTYEVGTEIQPGTYRTSGSDWCYWERLRSNDGEFDSILANGNADGPSSVSVKSSDKYIRFSGTCSWAKR
ncbi:hypothetical protein EV188_101128 [Actinomycetospora succinea]|uniref:Uncharacterized protein n=1 Tax=Actinomycetospora succinea TaxID=663603 RepID=A0A4R6VR13_9PSEU|nr:hypothetical protein [Actinomycetospora succinea]TDQ64880.1 hypothetical protein EV188_101128 [Actinomycetospora succinea]